MSTENTPTPATESNPGNPGVLSFTVSAVVLRAALKACAPAMSKDEARYILNGVHLELRPSSLPAIRDGAAPHVLTVAATDGRRLHVAQIPVDGLSLPPSPARTLSFIVPASAVRAALKSCFPAKLKNGEALLSFPRRASGLVNATPAPWLVLNTPCGEHATPAVGVDCNYPNIRQVIPALPPGRPHVFISMRDAENVAEIESAENARFTEACLSAAALSAAQAGLPFPSAQIRAATAPAVRTLIKTSRAKNPCAYFERGPGGRLIPLALSFGAVPPSFQFNADGTKVFPMGAKDVALSHPSGVCSIGSPAVAVAGINPAYLADLVEAVAAFNDVPGRALNGALIAKDENAPFVLSTSDAIDAGKGFSFLAVIMPQRVR